MSLRTTTRHIAVLLLLTLSLPAVAGYYKWKDDNGVTHFSDEPPGPDGKPVKRSGTTVIPMRANIRTQKRIEQLRNTRSSTGNARQTSNGKSDWEKEQERIELKRQNARCEKYNERIDWIDSRFRAGNYSVPYGNRLRSERRELS